MNNVVLVGRLTKDPEIGYSTNENRTAICRFNVAVDRNDKNGGADYIRCIAWGKLAENCDKYTEKGSLVAVQGSIRTGSYKNKDGLTVYTTDVFANSVQFLARPKHKSVDVDPNFDINQDYEEVDAFQEVADEIPF